MRPILLAASFGVIVRKWLKYSSRVLAFFKVVYAKFTSWDASVSPPLSGCAARIRLRYACFIFSSSASPCSSPSIVKKVGSVGSPVLIRVLDGSSPVSPGRLVLPRYPDPDADADADPDPPPPPIPAPAPVPGPYPDLGGGVAP